jgi:hypothetical protein
MRALVDLVKKLFIGLLLAHGAIHLVGFANAFGIGKIEYLTQPLSRPLGILWLLAALAFFASAALLSRSSRDWSIAATPAVVLSQILILSCWSETKIGTIANVIIVAPALFSLLTAQESEYRWSLLARNSRATAQ